MAALQQRSAQTRATLPYLESSRGVRSFALSIKRSKAPSFVFNYLHTLCFVLLLLNFRQHICFQTLAHSLRKNMGGGGGRVERVSRKSFVICIYVCFARNPFIICIYKKHRGGVGGSVRTNRRSIRRDRRDRVQLPPPVLLVLNVRANHGHVLAMQLRRIQVLVEALAHAFLNRVRLGHLQLADRL